MTRFNRRGRSAGRSALAAAWVFATAATAWSAQPLGSAFTYQGELELDGSPVNDTCDCHFSLWDDPSAGVQVGQTLMFDEASGVAPPIEMSNGVLKVELDFGVEVYSGDALWLEIAVACPAGGTLETLAPRQPITAAPYALQTRGIFVDDSGNVGMGTTTPNAGLHAKGDGTGAVVRLSNGGSCTEMNNTALIIADICGMGSAASLYGVTSEDLLHVQNDGAGKAASFRGDVAVQGGTVGIGTATAAVPLQVIGGGDLSSRIGGTFVIGEVAADNIGFDTNEIRARSAGAAATLHLNQEGGDVAISGGGNGRVGIGDSVPDARLDVVSTSEQVALFSQFGDQPGVAVTSFSESYSTLAVTGFSETVPALTVTGGARVDGLEILGTASDPALNVAGTARVGVLEIVGADVAERFPVSDEPKPGMVMEIDPDNAGTLRIARGAYNRRVAGVVSGANGLAAGTILGNLPGHEDAPPVALSGRVWTYCDATTHAVDIGDLLTTSNRPGHAMKVTEHARATGTILGKAMTALPKSETGLVLVLVNLQ